MALHWNAQHMIDQLEFKVIARDPDTNEEIWHPNTWHLILSTMVIGMDHISKDNYQLFADRMIEYERICGAEVRIRDGRCKLGYRACPTTEEMVRQHIGLSTNANPMTHTHFVKRKTAWRKQNLRRLEAQK